MANCFVCLNPAVRKVCPRCNCYAHNKCWGQYLQHTNEINTYILPGRVVVNTAWATTCPQCRGDIMEVKSVTRSDTDLARHIAIASDYDFFLTALDNVSSQEEEFSLYQKFMEIFSNNIAIIRKDEVLSSLIKSKLRRLYEEKGWNAANLYHHQFFGSQLAGS